ncbi:MAG TPA: toll/interleukin-1 receptor domain-containing protein, partial [Sorangium sp.]|nr:toll/interleukin-1 receptor domain-containing protein [Sorangium sp.]
TATPTAAPPAGQRATAPRPVRVFLSYAPRDEELLRRLEVHMNRMKREGLIAPWHSGEIGAGEDVESAISEQLEEADLILLLVSASFLASEEGDAQVTRAMERRDAGQATVVPILLRRCDWETTRLAGLQWLPRGMPRDLPEQTRKSLLEECKDHKPLAVTRWPDEDEAFLQVVVEIRALATKLRASLR